MLKRVASLPFLLFASLAGLLVASWVFVQALERRNLQELLDATSEQTASRLEAFLLNHVERIQLLGGELLLSGEVSEASFRRLASDHHRSHPGLQALNWVRTDGVIQWVEPQEPNRAAVGFDLTRHPVASRAFLQARAGDGVHATPPLELLQGGWGFAAYYALRAGGETLGYLNAVFRLPAMLASCLPEARRSQLAYFLRYGDELLGSLGPTMLDPSELPLAEATVHISGQELTLAVIAAPQLIAAKGTWVDESLLAVGLFLAASLALQVHVSRRRRRAAELGEARFRVLIDNAPDAIVAIDAATGRFLDANRRAHELFGLEPRRLVGLTPAELSADPETGGRPAGEAFAEHVDAARRGASPVFEWRLRRGGEERLAEVHLVRLPDPDRELVRASITDVTERRALDVELRRTQAHEAMGRLAGSVAHDFNNLLTAILGAAELVRERLAAGTDGRAWTDEIIATCGRAANLTRQLLAFSRHSALMPQPVDLNAVVAGIVPILERLMRGKVRIETRLEARSTIEADPSQLELALLNLAVNARDAMPRGGRLWIATGESKGQVELLVEDEGQGIPAQNLGRIFEPFFTTKDPGLGTGIGLATVKRVVEQAHGTIEARSTPGRGTSFRILFPACAGEPAQEAVPAIRPRASGGGQSILVVEDEPNVRRILRRALESADFVVTACTSAEEALRLAEDGTRFDLLVSDVVLPGLSGVELERALRRSRPEIRALLISGYSEAEEELTDLARDEHVAFLSKPFSPSELVERARELLAGCASR